MTLYPIVIHKDPDSDYGVTVPDQPCCFSAGVTMVEEIAMAQEAILGHIETLLQARQPIHELLPIEARMSNDFHSNGIWAVTEVDMSALAATVQPHD